MVLACSTTQIPRDCLNFRSQRRAKTDVTFCSKMLRLRGCQEAGVNYTQQAAEAGDEFAAVFYLGVALHEACQKVAELADAADDEAEDESLPPKQMFDVSRAQHSHEPGRNDAAREPLP